jgi:DNA-binding response OmpR family regulator
VTEHPDPYTVLIYSDDPQVRKQLCSAIGQQPAVGTRVSFVEAETAAQVVRLTGEGGLDLLVLDGEATPAGGIGVAGQVKAEVDNCPPTVVVLARAADRWLAAHAKVDAMLVHPVDPILAASTVVSLLNGAE